MMGMRGGPARRAAHTWKLEGEPDSDCTLTPHFSGSRWNAASARFCGTTTHTTQRQDMQTLMVMHQVSGAVHSLQYRGGAQAVHKLHAIAACHISLLDSHAKAQLGMSFVSMLESLGSNHKPPCCKHVHAAPVLRAYANGTPTPGKRQAAPPPHTAGGL